MSVEIDKQALAQLVGKALGTSDWFEIDQARVNRFADVTVDHQFVHVDPERARATPFGGTIAHGFLTLSLLVHLCLDFIPKLAGTKLMVNYGFDKIRFIAPVRVGRRIRAHGNFKEAVERKPGQFLFTIDVEVEIENEKKPALKAQWLSLHMLGDS
jgi:acyl dehydratase